MATVSHWSITARIPQFPSLRRNLSVDAAVIGAGNTGITTAYLLKKAGLRTALIERDRCARVDTGHTSAHLTHVTDLRLRALSKRFGRDRAVAIWDAGVAAIQQIEEIVKTERIPCDFVRVPGYLHAAIEGRRDERRELVDEAKLANELGFPAAYVNAVPVFGRPGICFPNQARIQPIKYLAGLVRRIPGNRSFVFENTEAEEFDSDSLRFKANGHTVSCKLLVIATDVPLTGRTNLASATLFQSKIAPYTSYCIGAKLPISVIPDALYWDTSDPYYFLRTAPSRTHDYAIFGGADHKTGQVTDPNARFELLERLLHNFVPHAVPDRRWSGQVIESIDGLPFIGETAEHQYVATGFSGNGLTFGTLAAMIVRDLATGRQNPWKNLFDVKRRNFKSLRNYLRENADYPYFMIKDRLAASDGKSARSVKMGQGKIIVVNRQRIAAYRSRRGRITRLSPVCTHLGCIVRWNSAEQTWDCPCHGSRFQPTGEVIAGPAESPLSQV